MKQHKLLIWTLVIMVLVAALYRIIPGRPYGFAPQWALALFGGAIIRDKKWALVMPVLSMFISDLLYFGLYSAGLSTMNGFYEGQWINYILFASVTVFGFFITRIKTSSIVMMSLLGPTWFFLVSNLLTWMGVGEFVEYPKTWEGLMTCYAVALPFYRTSLIATLFFSALLFGGWQLINRRAAKEATA